MRFLFRLDLSLYASAEKKIKILNCAIKHGVNLVERSSESKRVRSRTEHPSNEAYRASPYYWCFFAKLTFS